MLDYIITAVIVLAAVGYLIRVFVLAARGQAGACGNGCGCGSSMKRESNLGKRRDLITLNAGPTSPDRTDESIEASHVEQRIA